MGSDFDGQEMKMSEVFTGISALLLAPVMLPVAAAIDQPLVKSTLKQALLFSSRCQEAVAIAQERLEDGLAEVRAEVEAEQKDGHTAKANSQPVLLPRQEPSHRTPTDASQVATQLQDMINDLNAQTRWLTNGVLDLRMLLSMGLGAIALRQLFLRGLRLDDIPWYVLAWYALDTFVKFHPETVYPEADRARVQPQSEAADAQVQVLEVRSQ